MLVVFFDNKGVVHKLFISQGQRILPTTSMCWKEKWSWGRENTSPLLVNSITRLTTTSSQFASSWSSTRCQPPPIFFHRRDPLIRKEDLATGLRRCLLVRLPIVAKLLEKLCRDSTTILWIIALLLERILYKLLFFEGKPKSDYSTVKIRTIGMLFNWFCFVPK